MRRRAQTNPINPKRLLEKTDPNRFLKNLEVLCIHKYTYACIRTHIRKHIRMGSAYRPMFPGSHMGTHRYTHVGTLFISYQVKKQMENLMMQSNSLHSINCLLQLGVNTGSEESD